MHLTSSRFESTRNAFGKLSKSSFEYSINPSYCNSRVETHRTHFHSSSKFETHPKEDLLTKSKILLSSKPSSTPNDDSLLSNVTKEILGSNKTLDLPSRKIVHNKPLGSFKTFDSSHLDPPSCSKSKVKAAKT